MLTRLFRTFKTRARRFAADRRGNVAIISALALPALMGTFGLGTEVASWYAKQRAMQNAADSAALAAASNASTSYDVEAKAVTAQYGFKDGQDGVAVAVSDAATCPAGATAASGAPATASSCYSVTISRDMPLILAQFVGYKGDATVSGAPAKRISAAAVAIQSTVPRPYCLVTLGQSGITLQANGSPKADLSGCNVMSNGSADCNGHNLNADNGDAHGTNNNCGLVQHNNVPILPDPYSNLASNIPADPCAGVYPQGTSKKNGVQLSGDNVLGGVYPWSSDIKRCGDLKLDKDVTITNTNGPATLVIYNGDLDLNGHTLSTAPGSQLTIVFAGDQSSQYTHVPTGNGTLDIQAPTSGEWSGIAMYQAPNLPQGTTNITAAGNSPTWNITGVVYLPHSKVTFSGAVNKSANGDSCFVMVADSVLFNGTGSILAHGGCGKAGVDMPTNPVPGRGKLVA